MSSGLNLQKGSSVNRGESPLKQLKGRREQDKNIKANIVDFAKEHLLTETAEKFFVSKTSVAKLIAPLIKKGEIAVEKVILPETVSEIEEIILNSGTGSIKKIALSTNFDEAEIRIVKALLINKELNK